MNHMSMLKMRLFENCRMYSRADKESPCLIPLVMLKYSDWYPLVITQLWEFLYRVFRFLIKLSPKLKSGISLKSKCLGLKISINELIRLLPKMKKIITNNLLVPYLKREQRMKFCLKKRQAFDGKSQRSWSKNGNRICKK